MSCTPIRHLVTFQRVTQYLYGVTCSCGEGQVNPPLSKEAAERWRDCHLAPL